MLSRAVTIDPEIMRRTFSLKCVTCGDVVRALTLTYYDLCLYGFKG